MKNLKHPAGKIIELNKKYHKYFIRGENTDFISCTQFINKFFPEFKRDEIAKKYTNKRDLNWKAVAAGWLKFGKASAIRGNKYHRFAEKVYSRYMKGKSKHVGEDKTEISIEETLFDLYNNYIPLVPETIVGSLKLKIAGMVDLLFVEEQDNKLLIGDWKFVKEIKRTNVWENAYFPIQHMDNCNYYKYCLQLNLYSYIIKKEKYLPEFYNHEMKLFHGTEDGIETIIVPDMQENVRNMLIHWEKNL